MSWVSEANVGETILVPAAGRAVFICGDLFFCAVNSYYKLANELKPGTIVFLISSKQRSLSERDSNG